MNIIKKSVGVVLTISLLSIGAIPAKASVIDDVYQAIQGYTDSSTFTISNSTAVLPVTNPSTTAKPKAPVQPKTYLVSVTGYSSSVDETDDTPLITANGSYVHDGIIAANFLPFGTAIKIPELFGNKVFIVADRMNSRYWYNVDVWFTSKNIAKQFGRKTVKVEIVS